MLGRKEKESYPLGYTNKIGVILNEKTIGWSGSTPFVRFDENLVQLPLSSAELKIPREHTTRMTYLAWFSGFIAGARGEGGLRNLLIFILILSIATAGLVYFLTSGVQTGVSEVNNTMNNIANDMTFIREALNLTNTTGAVV